MQLDGAVYTAISDLADQGNIAMDQGQYQEAILLWEEALHYLPEPVTQWQAAFWLYASMAEGYYQLEDFEQAIAMLNLALECAEAKENPYPYYMMGKSYWRLNQEQAAEYLLKAYDLDGEGIFAADSVDGENCLQYLYDQGLL